MGVTLREKDIKGVYNQTKAAIIVFRSMEGVKRALRAFEFNYYKNIMRKYCKPLYENCISNARIEKMKFKDKLLSVKLGVEPELLNWENYSVTTPEKIIRQLIYAVWVIATLYACFMFVFTLEKIIIDAEAAVPTIVCKDGITAAMAEIDYNKKMFYRNGDFNCYCEKLLADDGAAKMREFAFPVSGDKKCSEYETAARNLTVLPLLMGVIIGIVNFITEQVVRIGTKYIKKPTD